MTPAPQPTWKDELDDILDGYDLGGFLPERTSALSRDEALVAITKLVEERIIGEDESLASLGYWGDAYRARNERNCLRAEQRTALGSSSGEQQ